MLFILSQHRLHLWNVWLCNVYCSYMVTHLMGADLNNIVKTQRLSDDHVQFLVYQILRGLKACIHTVTVTEKDIYCNIRRQRQTVPK